jgi:hypothetical protein
VPVSRSRNSLLFTQVGRKEVNDAQKNGQLPNDSRIHPTLETHDCILNLDSQIASQSTQSHIKHRYRHELRSLNLIINSLADSTSHLQVKMGLFNENVEC